MDFGRRLAITARSEAVTDDAGDCGHRGRRFRTAATGKDRSRSGRNAPIREDASARPTFTHTFGSWAPEPRRTRSLIKRYIAKRSGIAPGEAASGKPRVSPSSNALKMSAAAALTPSRVFLMCALVGSLIAATPRSTARYGPHIFKNLTSHAGGSSPVMASATFS